MKTGNLERRPFLLLLGSVFICGVAEGMLFPLLSSILETRGVPAIVNGIGTTALYLGMLFSSPFMERPAQKHGYKPLLFYGLILIAAALSLFPLWIDIGFWFLLRLIVGIGDSMLHFAAQTWIVTGSPVGKRGRNISLYGLSFGLGFAVGPVLIRLLIFGTWVPFVTGTAACLIFALPILLLKNQRAETPSTSGQQSSRLPVRCRSVIFAAWSGLVSTFIYGFLDSSLSNSFPIFALRSGYSLDTVALLLPTFVGAGLLTQLPIGLLGDRFGRRKLLPALTLAGSCCFAGTGFLYHSISAIFITLLLAGMMIGSLYSLSMSYVGDLLPHPLIPLGNILLTASYSIGCMIGPVGGSLLIGSKPDGRLFFSWAVLLAILSIMVLIHQHRLPGKRRTGNRLKPNDSPFFQ